MPRFSTTLDTTAKMVTIAVFVVVIFPFIFIFEALRATSELKLLFAPVLIALLTLICVLWKPNAYTLDAEGLTINRFGGDRHIPLSSIQSAVLTTNEQLGLGLRTFGSGGFFGYLGKFWYKNIKHVTMYVTDKSKMILITLDKDKKIMISPDDSYQFLKTLESLIKH